MSIEPVTRTGGVEPWIAVVLFACLAILVWVKTDYPRKIPRLFREVITGDLPEKEKGITLPAVLLFLIYLFCLALLIVTILPLFFTIQPENEFVEFLLIAAGILLFYIAKTVLILITGFVFQEQAAAWDYISEIYLFTHLCGILLLPAAAVMIYAYGIDRRLVGEILAGAGALIIIYRTIRAFLHATGMGLRAIYLILYICALELAPLSLFIKFGLISYLR